MFIVKGYMICMTIIGFSIALSIYFYDNLTVLTFQLFQFKIIGISK